MQTSTVTTQDDVEYDRLIEAIGERFRSFDGEPLFTTDAGDLFGVYLAHLPAENRHFHTCHACRRFFELYGGLVTINMDGRVTPALWSVDAPDYYRPALEAVAREVRRARVTGVFMFTETVWGTASSPKNAKHGGEGAWSHYHVKPSAARVFRGRTQTPFQAMAEKREDRGNVCRALGEFPVELLRKAVKILEADALYRGEKVLGAAQWLLDLARARDEAQGKDARENVVWRAIAAAPAGFCHPRSSMIGTLLEDLAAGMDVDACARRFADKMHPLRYQRPQAAPSEGTIKQAEELFAKLGLAPALERRFARVEEIDAFWRPTDREEKPREGGVFAHLTPKGRAREAAGIDLPTARMTWEKFAREVLPDAASIELDAPSHGNYTAILTAVHADAPPLLQWDSEDRRNPFSLYVWHGGSSNRQFGVSGWTKVAALTRRPPFWYGAEGFTHHDRGGVIFILDGARETRTNSGAALFPETIRSELHGVRSVIEAYSRSAAPQGAAEGSACGLLCERDAWGVRLRVTDRDGDRRQYVIDRRD